RWFQRQGIRPRRAACAGARRRLCRSRRPAGGCDDAFWARQRAGAWRIRARLMPAIFERIAIVGAGLIGASIALAARQAAPARAVAPYAANAAVRQRARDLGLGDVFDDAEAAVADADLVVLAVPVGAMGEAAGACARALKASAIVPDVGSVKQAVVEAVG